MKLFGSLKFSRLKRLPEVLTVKEKNIMAILSGVAILSGLFLAGQFFWIRSQVISAPGGDYSEAARELGISRQGVTYHVRLANRHRPLIVPRVTIQAPRTDREDLEALAAYVRGQLERVGVRRE